MQDNIVTPIPVFYIHSFYEPFCSNPLCQCQRRQKAVKTLFANIIEGKLEIEKVVDLTEKEGEGK